jgi:hypothetical protein
MRAAWCRAGSTRLLHFRAPPWRSNGRPEGASHLRQAHQSGSTKARNAPLPVNVLEAKSAFPSSSEPLPLVCSSCICCRCFPAALWWLTSAQARWRCRRASGGSTAGRVTSEKARQARTKSRRRRLPPPAKVVTARRNAAWTTASCSTARGAGRVSGEAERGRTQRGGKPQDGGQPAVPESSTAQHGRGLRQPELDSSSGGVGHPRRLLLVSERGGSGLPARAGCRRWPDSPPGSAGAAPRPPQTRPARGANKRVGRTTERLQGRGTA